jgi:hypothetical protein
MQVEEPAREEIELYQLNVITEELSRFAKLLEKILGEQKNDRSERERFKFILMGVAHFLKGIGSPLTFANEYVKLAYMLEDLEVGKVHPALMPETVVGPPDTTADWLISSDICLGMVAVMAAGRSQGDAAKYVARHMGVAVDKVRRSRQGEPWRAIRGWHEQFSAGSVTNDVAQSAYTANNQLVTSRITAAPEEERLLKAKNFLNHINSKILSM